MRLNSVYLMLGSNIGNPLQILKDVVGQISDKVGSVQKKSGIYTSGSWGYQSENAFYNQAVCVHTTFSPEMLLANIQKIETDFGRIRNRDQYIDRTIDIDILFYNDSQIETESLIVPHPLLHLRKFVLVPLNQIAPDYIHPTLKKTVSTLLINCNDPLKVEFLNDPI